ncbi:MAG TPA: VWA domain-containing protein [Mycobacterium sp.]|nr:VWA domain-containing protein [Mycobacterium sp.]
MPLPLLAVLVVITVAGSASAVIALRHHSKKPSLAAASETTPQAVEPCRGTLPLQVDAAPSIATPVRTVATQWARTRPSAAGQCVSVTVKAVEPAKEATQLASATSPDTTLWIPDSSLWADKVQAAKPVTAAVQIDAPIATSPLVLVASPGAAATLRQSATAWGTVISGKLPATIPDPTVNTDGLLGLLAIRAPVGGSAATPSTQLVGVMIGMSHAALPNAAAGFAKLAASPGTSPIFAASEQEVISANTANHSVFAAAVYPPETPSLDFPVVRLTRPADTAALTAAAKQFETQLRTTAAQAQFSAAGLRDPAGDPVARAGAAEGVQSAKVTQLPRPTSAQALDVTRMWSAAAEDSRLLAVIDVSGSMGERAGNGQTKIQLVAAAAETAVGFFPPTSDIGLWAFSTKQTATTDWAQLVPLGPLTTAVGNVPRRQALLAAAAKMPARVGGDTALYDTALAAFEDVRNTYDPAKVNSVVLMTDGQNVDPGGISLNQLISTLRSQVDPARPVPIITIGIGTSVDVSALQAISAATGGKTYLVKNPADIRGVFLDAIIQRQCRPTC